jgi:hypothetical protein
MTSGRQLEELFNIGGAFLTKRWWEDDKTEEDDTYGQYEDEERKASTERKGKEAEDSKLGTNDAENETARAIGIEAGLMPGTDEWRRFHDEISRKGYTEEELKEIAESIVRERRSK